MTIPDEFYRFMFSQTERQENLEYDSNGNEIYHGIASKLAATSDAVWVIAKGVYTQDAVNTTVWRMTHISFLKGQIWDNRASISFP